MCVGFVSHFFGSGSFFISLPMKVLFFISLMLIFASCNNQSMENPELKKTFSGDAWEARNALYNGNPFNTLDPTGDMEDDFAAFTMGQGGGKSYSLSDSAVTNPGAFFSTPDVDGRYPHTVNDITKPFFCTWAPKVGIKPTAENFYNMDDELHSRIVDAWINSTKETTSPLCNLVLDLAEWGSGGGGRRQLINAFHVKYGNISAYAAKSEYVAFLALLQIRMDLMKQIPDRLYQNGRLIDSSTTKKLRPLTGQTLRWGWPSCGAGWGSGLAHFHRVFKHYAKN